MQWLWAERDAISPKFACTLEAMLVVLPYTDSVMLSVCVLALHSDVS